jgi:tetraacyldisaccharide 4'-kinase
MNYLLLPLSGIFYLLVQLRFWLYKVGFFKIYISKIPVIVVGNITVGGTGKTPIVISMVKHFESQGKTVGVVSRGYKGNYLHKVLEVTSTTDPQECGDEPALIAQNTNAKIVVAKKRVEAVKHLTDNEKVDVIISDDGLQHYAMGRDIEIAVIDGVNRFGNGFLLPAGLLREPVKRLKSVDIIINNGANLDGELNCEIKAESFVNIASEESQPLNYFKDKECYAVAGIGNPTKFFKLLDELGVRSKNKAFVDHHRFVAEDFAFAEDYPIIMTSKDCVKCRHFATDQMWYLSVHAELNSDFYQQLESKL